MDVTTPRSFDDRHANAPPVQVPVASSDLQVPVSMLPTGWNVLLSRSPKVATRRAMLDIDSPRVLSVRCGKAAIKIRSFTFPDAPSWGQQSESSAAARPRRPGGSKTSRPKKNTRIAPPNDVIKLQDRLYYVLQPSLEIPGHVALAASFPSSRFRTSSRASLSCTLVTRPILADEMGLGKTMQAITHDPPAAVRRRSPQRVAGLSQAAGDQLATRVRRCGRPEIPLAIIEGDQTRRHWQWQLPQAAGEDRQLRIADARPRRARRDPDLHFDLVVLDEAQRIKNRSSTTSQVVRSIPATRSWALTGTPVENSPEDLVGIFEFLAPGYLSPDMKPRADGAGHAATTFCGAPKTRC